MITLSNSSHHLTHTAITLISLNNRSSKLIRAWKEGGCRRGVVAQWQSTGGSSQRPWVQFPAAPLFLSSPCRFKGLRTVAAPIVSINDTITIGLRTTEESCPSDSSTAVIMLSNSSHHLTHTAITLISLNNRSSKLIRAWKEGGCRRGVVAQWQSTGGSSQRLWVRFPAAPLFLSSPCRFKGLRMVAAPIVSINDTITIGLRTTEESCPSDSSTAVITLSNSSHQLVYNYLRHDVQWLHFLEQYLLR